MGLGPADVHPSPLRLGHAGARKLGDERALELRERAGHLQQALFVRTGLGDAVRRRSACRRLFGRDPQQGSSLLWCRRARHNPQSEHTYTPRHAEGPFHSATAAHAGAGRSQVQALPSPPVSRPSTCPRLGHGPPAVVAALGQRLYLVSIVGGAWPARGGRGCRTEARC